MGFASPFFSKFLLLALILFSSVTYSDTAGKREPGWCRRQLIKIGDSYRTFRSELSEEGWRRIFLKKPPADEPPGWQLLVPYEPPERRNLFQKVVVVPFNFIFDAVPHGVTYLYYKKRHDLNLIHGAIHNLIKRPIRKVTEKWTEKFSEEKQKLDPSRLLLIPLAGGLIYGYTQLQDKAAKEVLDETAKAEIERDHEIYDDMIENDYAFFDIRDALKTGKINRQEARERAFNRYHRLKRYDEYMISHPQVAVDTPEAFLENPLFEDIKVIHNKGIPVPKGYRKAPGFTAKLSDEQLQDLLDLRHTLFSNYNVIELWVNDPEKLAKRMEDPKVKEIVENITGDPFVKELQDHYKAGKISQRQYTRRLKEDAYWRVKFAEWQVLKLEKQKSAGDGKFSDETLYIDDIQDETRRELGIPIPQK